MNTSIALLVKDEIEKILDARFICPIDYSPWISNIVVVSKGENKISMCTNFCDLNKASLKDEFPLPNIDMIMDSTVKHVLLSLWMDSLGIIKFLFLLMINIRPFLLLFGEHSIG